MKINGTNISMIRGDTESIIVSYENLDGTKIDFIAGDTIYFTVKQGTNTEKKSFQKVITEFNDGKAIFEITSEDTKDLSYRTYKYDVQFNTSDGKKRTIIPASNFVISEEVTYE